MTANRHTTVCDIPPIHLPNLMDTHPPGLFQIDGNLGAANECRNALVKSRWFLEAPEIDLLSVAPSAVDRRIYRGL